MIDSIDLSKLRNGEYSQFMQDVISITNSNDPAAMQVLPQLTALTGVANEIETLFKVPTGSAITAELENFDMKRDNALRGITSIVHGYTYSEDLVLNGHAVKLETHLALFGKDIAADSYQSETSSIRNIITDWNEKPELTAAITGLNLLSWKASLETANNNFSDRYLQRAVELGADTAESIKEKRLLANEAYYKLRDNINARYIIAEGAEPYKTVVASVNGLISYYNDMLARRVAGSTEEIPPVVPAPVA